MDAPRTMITMRRQHVKFTYRIGGIVLHQGRVLFQNATLDPRGPFWFLPGGRAEIGESSEETLAREMMEELHLPVTVERPLFLVENFFTEREIAHHELGLYFLMHFPDDAYIYHTPGPFIYHDDQDDSPMIFDWVPLTSLKEEIIYPPFFAHALQSLPDHLTHIINNNLPSKNS